MQVLVASLTDDSPARRTSLILRQPRRRLGHRIAVVHQQDARAVSVSLPRGFALRYRRVFGKNLQAGSHRRSREISNRLDAGELRRYSCFLVHK